MIIGQGGKVSQERTEEILIEAILKATGVDPVEAQQRAENLMKEYPGMFVTGQGEDGNLKVVNPQSAAFLQMPFDLAKLGESIFSGEPASQLLKMSSPVIGIGAVMLPGGYDTFFGEPMSGDENAWGRLWNEIKSFLPFYKLGERLTQPSSDSATFTFDRKQAIEQYAIGTIAERGLQVKAAAENIASDEKTKGGARAGPGVSRTGETTAAAKNVFWLKHNPGKSDPELMRYAISRRKIEDAYQKGYERLQDGGHVVNKVTQIWLMVDVLMRMRPGVATRKMAAEWKKMADSGDEFQKDTAYAEVNAFLHFSDIFGRQIETEIKNIQGEG
jgi:hypothetical protein